MFKSSSSTQKEEAAAAAADVAAAAAAGEKPAFVRSIERHLINETIDNRCKVTLDDLSVMVDLRSKLKSVLEIDDAFLANAVAAAIETYHEEVEDAVDNAKSKLLAQVEHSVTNYLEVEAAVKEQKDVLAIEGAALAAAAAALAAVSVVRVAAPPPPPRRLSALSSSSSIPTSQTKVKKVKLNDSTAAAAAAAGSGGGGAATAWMKAKALQLSQKKSWE